VLYDVSEKGMDYSYPVMASSHLKTVLIIIGKKSGELWQA
jgi:hypothetical protein